jgi:hypothetical protein
MIFPSSPISPLECAFVPLRKVPNHFSFGAGIVNQNLPHLTSERCILRFSSDRQCETTFIPKRSDTAGHTWVVTLGLAETDGPLNPQATCPHLAVHEQQYSSSFELF